MQGYLRDLDAQIREKKERDEREAQEELKKDRSLIRRNNFGDWRVGMGPHRGGGGGEPLRDEAGRMCAGVRGLFNREINGYAREPAVAVRHADPEGAVGFVHRPTSASRPPTSASSAGSSPGASHTARSAGRIGGVPRRDPNAGHRIFGSDAPAVRRLHDARPTSSRGSLVAAHEVAGTDGPVQPYRVPGCGGREYRAAPEQQQYSAPRLTPESQQQQQWRRPRQQHQHLHLQPDEMDGSPRGRCGSSKEERKPLPPQSSHDRIEVSAKWLEQLLLERDRRRQESDQLRRQLREAGVIPCI